MTIIVICSFLRQNYRVCNYRLNGNHSKLSSPTRLSDVCTGEEYAISAQIQPHHCEAIDRRRDVSARSCVIRGLGGTRRISKQDEQKWGFCPLSQSRVSLETCYGIKLVFNTYETFSRLCGSVLFAIVPLATHPCLPLQVAGIETGIGAVGRVSIRA
jgi:hypothetical protein